MESGTFEAVRSMTTRSIGFFASGSGIFAR